MEFLNKEELYFNHYLAELQKHGYIYNFEYQPESFIITDSVSVRYYREIKFKKTKNMYEKHLLRDLKYTPDFKIEFTTKGYGWLFDVITHGNIISNPNAIFFCCENRRDNTYTGYVDTKAPERGIKNDSFVTFPIKQKILFSMFRIYVQKVVVPDIFITTFTPAFVLYNETYSKSNKLGKFTKGQFKYKYEPKLIHQFLENHGN